MGSEGSSDLLGDVVRELLLLSRHSINDSKSWASTPLKKSAHLLLSRLALEETMTLRELATAFHLDVSTVNRQTAPLLEAGWVQRVDSEPGSNARALQITAEGRALVTSQREELRAQVGDLLTDWSVGHTEQLARSLQRFNESAEDHHEARWPR